jgi:hypothetical protein
VALVYDFVAGTALLYVNGQRVSSGPIGIPLGAINDLNVWLGRSNWPDPYFNGQLDEFRIYNGVLSDAAVAASFAAGQDALLGTPPTLGAAQSGNSIILTWPSGAAAFALETATNLQTVAIWTVVTNVPTQQNGQLTLSLPITNAIQFFRLRK